MRGAESEPKRQRVETSLYILRIAGDTAGLFGLKVGRTGDLSERTRKLETSMPFRVDVLAEFPGAGHLELAVHSLLAYRRNTAGRGREWFRVPLSEALHAVACVLAGNINALDSTTASDGSGRGDALARRSSVVDSDSS